jgi:predicted CXXCH cytochrome family protein
MLCHEPHQGAVAGLLKKKPVEMCASCHAPLAARIRDGSPHKPVAMGMCLTCHAGHGSANAGMLRREVPAMCGSCHSPKNEAVIAKHPGMNLETTNCVSCHDPHVQRKGAKGLIKEFRHDPFARGECTACHTSRGSATTVSRGQDLCLKCHEEAKAWASKKHVHAALEGERQCLACHEPHAGAAVRLLRRSRDELCISCHGRKLLEGRVTHAALQQGCTKCHDPHASDNLRLAIAPVNTLCQSCHTDLSKHYHKVQGVTDPRSGEELNCTGCHRPHAADEASLLAYDPKRELCIQCHDPNMAPPPKK